MTAHQRQIRRPLHHAHVVLAVALVLHAAGKLAVHEPKTVIAVHEEGAHVDRPVRTARRHEAETGRNLPAERVPVRARVAVPRDRGVALLSGEARTGQIHHTLFVRRRALVLVYSAGVVQREKHGAFRAQRRREAFIA